MVRFSCAPLSRYPNAITALEQTTYDRSQVGHEQAAVFTRRMGSERGVVESAPREAVAVRDYGACGKLDFDPDDFASDRRLGGDMAEKILRTFGNLFPYKNV